jgi:uncharacterized protein YbjT (DUF2867 family)
VKVLILGATGLVGRHALALALARPEMTAVIAPTRRPLPPHAKLTNPIAPQLEQLLSDVAHWAADAAICAMGTTIKIAGSQQAFRAIDHDLQLAFAQATHRAGTRRFALVSSMGASAGSSVFYARVKGELERDIRAIGFQSLCIARPFLIGGHLDEARAAERIGLTLARVLGPVLPKRFQIDPAPAIAQALIDAIVAGVPGCQMRYSASLTG